MIIKEQWPEENPKQVNNVEAIIKEFDKLDQTGSGLRYECDKQERMYSGKYPPGVDLLHMKNTFDSIFNFLEVIDSQLKEYVDRLLEEQGIEK